MEVMYPRCCGLDVHKSSITACVLVAQSGKPLKHIRRFGCTTGELRELVVWLQEFDVEHVAMESTGVYWKPVWNVLESHFQIVLANAQHIKAVPGRKTDTKDCQWIAELLQHGLLRGSFIPPLVIRDLRDLTRARTSLSQEHSRIASRIQKVLEDANLKLASVASNTLGKSGRAILAAIIGGEESPERLADLALGHLRVKIPQLQAALEGRVREHHRFLLRSLLRQLQFLEAEIASLDARLDQLGQEQGEIADALNRWITVPGVDRVAAWVSSQRWEQMLASSQLQLILLAGQACVQETTRVPESGSAARSVKVVHGCVAWPANLPGQQLAPRTRICPPSLRDLPLAEAGSAPSSLSHTASWSLDITYNGSAAPTPIWAAITSTDSTQRV